MADRVEPRTTSGKPIPSLNSVSYLREHKFPKVAVPVGPIHHFHDYAGKALKRNVPDWTKEDHIEAAHYHRRAYEKADEEWQRVVKIAHQAACHRKWTILDYRISGIGREEYSEVHKKRLRDLTRAAAAHYNLAYAHLHAAGLRSNTISRIIGCP